jgi:hypothetical protein
MKRVAPAIGLVFLAPVVAEFLLGNLPITMLPALLVLAPLYGGGALMVRETARRLEIGWPGIVTLALAYAIVEEAFTTQTLFNPNYLKQNLHLLDPAYVPALGMGGWWTVFVLTLHVVWSISVSIALVEALVPDRETTPWLGLVGLTITGVLFMVGIGISTAMTLHSDSYVASARQLVSAAVFAIGLVVVAFRLTSGTDANRSGQVPGAWLVGVGALLAGSIFLVVPKSWGWGAVGVYLALDVGVIGGVWVWSRRAAWDGRHRLALAGGAALAYAWHAFPERPVVGDAGTSDLVGNAIFATALVAWLVVAARRQSIRARS